MTDKLGTGHPDGDQKCRHRLVAPTVSGAAPCSGEQSTPSMGWKVAIAVGYAATVAATSVATTTAATLVVEVAMAALQAACSYLECEM